MERSQNDPVISVSQWAQIMDSFSFQGLRYTLNGNPQDEIQANLAGIARGAYKTDGVVFACMLVRMLLFSEARFLYRRQRKSRPGDLFGFNGDDLGILRNPWDGGTTGDLLTRMIQYADLGGNSFVARRSDHLFVARPDWITIVGGSNEASTWDPDATVLGYVYEEGGINSGGRITTFLPDEMAHFAPIPDPELRFRGMSWLTPIVREIMSDKAATDHKLAFFENGATPNLVVKLDTPNLDTYKAYVELFKAQHDGVGNAYRTMFLGAGADATVVGADLKQLDFKVVQGAGETRIAAAAGVPPVIVGLSEGLDAATYSNYAQACRRFADATLRPLWRNVAGSLARIIQVPSDAELWYDDRDIPFLKEDTQVAAEVQSMMAQTMKALIDAGFESDSVVNAVTAGDLSLLQHTGLFSVQLQPAGTVSQGKGALVTGVPVPTNALPPATSNSLEPAGPTRADVLRDLRDLAILAAQQNSRPIEIHLEPRFELPAGFVEVPVTVNVPERSVTVEAAPPPEVKVEVPVTIEAPQKPSQRRVDYPGGHAVVTEDRIVFDDGQEARITDL